MIAGTEACSLDRLSASFSFLTLDRLAYFSRRRAFCAAVCCAYFSRRRAFLGSFFSVLGIKPRGWRCCLPEIVTSKNQETERSLMYMHVINNGVGSAVVPLTVFPGSRLKMQDDDGRTALPGT